MSNRFTIRTGDIFLRKGDVSLFDDSKKDESLFRALFTITRGVSKLLSQLSTALNDGLGGGDATIASGSTSVTVTHNLGFTPTAKDLSLVQTNNPTNDAGFLFADNFTSTTFRVNCRTDPGASGLSFSWQINRV